ncbi:MAG: NAD(P)/FAD-dependent oxidoreductase [Caldimicrobium sp.]|nr:NAD(P)/FAD-dependent oxidoreductase [Caldimicrobium sp.]MCX7873417.1 NAD(P)/FAD-dependent oxidoreductase [Caldimicrobium sp.]MDW8094395.1 NAD(P)/FAD-dependent oxidoreductase [Caldimicrobium sp.]
MKEYEIVIIGVGPAGLQAAIHSARRKHKVLLLGKLESSALYHAHIENYFGFREKVQGQELLLAGLDAAKKFGADFIEEDVVKIEILEQGDFKLETEKGTVIRTKALILALGVKKKKKIFKNEDSFIGKGISYCVDCDAWFYKNKRVAVIGDGSAALHGAMTLSKFASKVYLIFLKELDDIIEELKNSPIELIFQKPVEILGEEEVRGLRFEGDLVIEVDGIFIELGAKGPLELLAPLGIELDPETFSYVKVDKKMQTNISGIFACGDLTGPPLQLAKAVGEGCIAGISASDYIKSLQKASK